MCSSVLCPDNQFCWWWFIFLFISSLFFLFFQKNSMEYAKSWLFYRYRNISKLPFEAVCQIFVPKPYYKIGMQYVQFCSSFKVGIVYTFTFSWVSLLAIYHRRNILWLLYFSDIATVTSLSPSYANTETTSLLSISSGDYNLVYTFFC